MMTDEDFKAIEDFKAAYLQDPEAAIAAIEASSVRAKEHVRMQHDLNTYKRLQKTFDEIEAEKAVREIKKEIREPEEMLTR